MEYQLKAVSYADHKVIFSMDEQLVLSGAPYQNDFWEFISSEDLNYAMERLDYEELNFNTDQFAELESYITKLFTRNIESIVVSDSEFDANIHTYYSSLFKEALEHSIADLIKSYNANVDSSQFKKICAAIKANPNYSKLPIQIKKSLEIVLSYSKVKLNFDYNRNIKIPSFYKNSIVETNNYINVVKDESKSLKKKNINKKIIL